MSKALFLSIKPEFVEKIFNGSKSIELRKSVPKAKKGDLVIIYSTSPIMSIVGTCRIQEVFCMKPSELWSAYSQHLGIGKKEFREYYQGKSVAVAIRLSNKRKLNEPISLKKFRKTFSAFQPPQTFSYVEQSYFVERI